MLFSISKKRTRSCQSFFYKTIVYNKVVGSLDYLNRCKVLYVYVDVTVLVWQNLTLGYGVNGAQGFLKRH